MALGDWLAPSRTRESLACKQKINGYLRQIEEFLVDNKARVLGIYGMGSIGKMTLLKIFNDDILVGIYIRMFDHVFFIKVSQVVEVEKIKKDITDQLGRTLSSLRNPRFLLLLDNVWKEVDLMTMEIPLPSSENVIMTSKSKSYDRIKHVDPKYDMQSLELSTLTKAEAWMFFQMKVGKDLDSKGGEIARLVKTMASNSMGFLLLLKSSAAV